MRELRKIVVEGPCAGSWSKEGELLGVYAMLGERAESDCLFAWFANMPSRPIDWRWMLALERPRDRFGDAQLRVALRYLSKVVGSDEANDELQWMHDAWSIWRQRRWPRMELESRVLAGHSCDEIAMAMQISVDCVRLYEAMFFDVRDRREASGFMYAAALGGSDVGSPQRPLYDVIKRLAYGGGPVVLDCALRAAKATPEELEGDDDDINILRHFRLHLIIEQVPLNRVTGPHFMLFPAARRRGQADWLKVALPMLDDAYANIDLIDADLWPALRKVYVEHGLREPESHESAVEASSSDAAAVAS
ncbi:MAG: hypothetical protein O2856_14425, partial [Planctomycetota bacterium]|nr:hypothetical protein [Planctomycetota bacterium]